MREQGVYHVHVMKTGGTSFTRVFRDLFGQDRSYPDAADPQARRIEKFAPRYLLEMDGDQRARYGFVSLHAGAWVADTVFPDHLSVAVLRDPVERTISHLRQLAKLRLTPTDLEEIYLEPVWHARLVDHQTQVFAASKEDYLEQESHRQEYELEGRPEAERQPIRELMWAAFATTIGATRVIDETSYAEAESRLDRIDEVGVTERLDDLVARVGARLGRPLPEVGRDNVGAGPAEVPAALRARIEEDSRWDRRLYERALTRAEG